MKNPFEKSHILPIYFIRTIYTYNYTYKIGNVIFLRKVGFKRTMFD